MEEKRKYNGEDSNLIEKSAEFSLQTSKDLADFTAFDTTINAGFITDLDAKIESILNITNDETRTDIQAQLTENVVKKMRECQVKYNAMKYFAEQAFPGNKRVQDEFGTNNYREARNSQGHLITFMHTLHVTATKYNTQLIAKGCTQVAIDDILTLGKALLDLNAQQDSFINNRPVDTQERITELNELYDMVAKICAAAQIIYEGNTAKQSYYVFNPEGGTSLVTLSGVVPIAGISSIIELPYRASRHITFSNTGTIPLLFGLGTTDNAMGGFNPELAVEDSEMYRSDELLDGGTFVLVRNASQTQGAYTIVYEA